MNPTKKQIEQWEVDFWQELETNPGHYILANGEDINRGALKSSYFAARTKAQKENDLLSLEKSFFEKELTLARNEIVEIKPKIKTKEYEITKLKAALKREQDCVNEIHDWYARHRRDDGEVAFELSLATIQARLTVSQRENL